MRILLGSFFILIGCAQSGPVRHGAASVTEAQIEEYRLRVKTVVDAKTQEIKDCYIVGLKENPELAGEINLEWTIDVEGQIKELTMRSSTLKSKSAETCAINKIRRWTFPVPPERHEVVVVFPFQFERGPGAL